MFLKQIGVFTTNLSDDSTHCKRDLSENASSCANASLSKLFIDHDIGLVSINFRYSHIYYVYLRLYFMLHSIVYIQLYIFFR